MDLREKPKLFQKVAESAVRFRLIEVVILLVIFAVAFASNENILGSLVRLSETVSGVLTDFLAVISSLSIEDGFLTEPIMTKLLQSANIPFAILVIFLFRWKFFGFKCGLLWFFFLAFNSLFMLALGECKDFLQIIIAVILMVSVTGYFFIRSLLIKSVLPLLFLGWTLSAWLLFLGVSDFAWFGLLSLLFADAWHLVFGVRAHLFGDVRKKKTLGGAIASGARKTLPVSLLTVALLIILDLIFAVGIKGMSVNVAAYIGYVSYVLWMPFFTAAVLSFCPLENTCEKIRLK
ncbi:hypothetical protein AGMMS49938_15480 [Fibrobacterales bacterium]|nr:hypothetical protein AGMMS49938_15480 [Fibrobacterales bacterium]